MLKSKHERARARFTSPSGMIDHYVPDGKPYEGERLPVVARFNFTSVVPQPLIEGYIVLFPERKVFSGGYPIAVEMRGSWFDITNYLYDSWEGFKAYRFYVEKCTGESSAHLSTIRARLPDGSEDAVVAYFAGSLLEDQLDMVPEGGFNVVDVRFKLHEPVFDIQDPELKQMKHYYVWTGLDLSLVLHKAFGDEFLADHHEALDAVVAMCLVDEPDRYILKAPRALKVK